MPPAAWPRRRRLARMDRSATAKTPSIGEEPRLRRDDAASHTPDGRTRERFELRAGAPKAGEPDRGRARIERNRRLLARQMLAVVLQDVDEHVPQLPRRPDRPPIVALRPHLAGTLEDPVESASKADGEPLTAAPERIAVLRLDEEVRWRGDCLETPPERSRARNRRAGASGVRVLGCVPGWSGIVFVRGISKEAFRREEAELRLGYERALHVQVPRNGVRGTRSPSCSTRS